MHTPLGQEGPGRRVLVFALVAERTWAEIGAVLGTLTWLQGVAMGAGASERGWGARVRDTSTCAFLYFGICE